MAEQWGKSLSLYQLAKYTGMSTSFINQNWRSICKEHNIRVYQPGTRKFLIDRGDVDKWLAKRQVKL